VNKTRVVLLIEKVVETEEGQGVVEELVDRILALDGRIVQAKDEADVGAGDMAPSAEPEPAVNPSGWTFRDFEALWESPLSARAKKVLGEMAMRPSGYPDQELAAAVGMKTIQEVGGTLASLGRRLSGFPGRDPVYRKEGGIGGRYVLAPEVAGFILVLANHEGDENPGEQESPEVTAATRSIDTGRTNLSPHARSIYEYLRLKVVPDQKVVTYADITDATGVPMGEEGGYMGQKLGEIFEACDARRLPPITSVVVRKGEGGSELYDPAKRHGMPGPGYFRACAHSPNQAGRREDPELGQWALKPAPAGFDPDTERWGLREMIEEHQNSVWKHRSWPMKL